MWERYTERARRAVWYAEQAAERQGGDTLVTPEHLLAGLLVDGDTFVGAILGATGVSQARLRHDLPRVAAPFSTSQLGTRSLSEDAVRALQSAHDESRRMGCDYVGTQHLLLGLLALSPEPLSRRFVDCGLTLITARKAAVAAQANRALGASSRRADSDILEPLSWSRFTERGRRVLEAAQRLADARGESLVKPEHLLLAILEDDSGIGTQLIERAGYSSVEIAGHLAAILTPGPGRDDQPLRLDPNTRRVLDLAVAEAGRLRNQFIGPEHLLLGIVIAGNGPSGIVLRQFGPSREGARAALESLLGEPPPPPPASTPAPVGTAAGGAALRQLPAAASRRTATPAAPSASERTVRILLSLILIAVTLLVARGCHG